MMREFEMAGDGRDRVVRFIVMGFNGLVYLLTDIDGTNYTFHLRQDWINFAPQMVFIIIMGHFQWNGAVSIVSALVAMVVGTANLGF